MIYINLNLKLFALHVHPRKSDKLGGMVQREGKKFLEICGCDLVNCAMHVDCMCCGSVNKDRDDCVGLTSVLEQSQRYLLQQ